MRKIIRHIKKNNMPIFLALCLTLLGSCSKENEPYAPLRASAMIRGELVSVDSKDNKDALSNKDFIDEIIIIGDQSDKTIPFTVINLADDSDERNFISFNAEIPDVKNFIFKNEYEAYGQSIVSIIVKNQTIKLQCSFKFICSNPDSFGNNSIILEKIEYNGNTILREDNLINSNIVLYLDESTFN